MTKGVLYIDLDNTLVDFASGIARLCAEDTETYRGNYGDASGIFALMDPMPGAIEAHAELAGLFDTYLLSRRRRGTTSRRKATSCSGCSSTSGTRAKRRDTSG